MSHTGYLHGPLQMCSPENGACNYLPFEKIYGVDSSDSRCFAT